MTTRAATAGGRGSQKTVSATRETQMALTNGWKTGATRPGHQGVDSGPIGLIGLIEGLLGDQPVKIRAQETLDDTVGGSYDLHLHEGLHGVPGDDDLIYVHMK